MKQCQPCQESRPAPPSAPSNKWESVQKPWSRVHVDFAGPFQGHTFLVTVDSYSKWLEVNPITTMSAAAAIQALRKIFATHCLPDTLVSNNGMAFTAREFQEFVKRNGIRHVRSTPFHPATNVQAERMVRTTKDSLSRLVTSEWQTRVAEFLLYQHVTPCSATGHSPAELLMGRRLTTQLDRIHPDHAPEGQLKTEDRDALRGFFPGDTIYA